jgi:diguanylate cyclase (GGDEF)-like protein/PAS domain S-box-containing protein
VGRPADELMGQSLHDIFPAEHAALYLQRVRHVIDTEQPEWREEWSFHPTDRRLFWTGVFPLHHADGSPFAVQVVSHEITALKQAEEALRESEERFRIVSELISDWAFCHMMTPEGRVEFGWITPSFYRLTGYAREDFPTPAEWAHVVHPDDMPILRQRIQNLLAGRIDVSEYRYRAKDGTMRWLRDYGQPEWDTAEQRTVRVFGAAQDITAHKQAEAVLHERVRQFEALRETMNEITAELELAPLLQAILERAIDLLNATAGQVELYDNEQNTLLILAGTDMHPGLVGTYQPLSERGLGVVIRTRRPLVIHDYQQWHEQMPSYARFDVHSLLLVPLLAGERVLGIISVGHKDADRIFDDADIELLTLFAQQATIAIQNAHLFAEMQRLATTDPLTGLHNRRSFFHLAQRAFEQATRYGHPLSIVMLDIDHFKQINDSVGHLMGDQVLQAVAYQCLSVLRAVDIVGRYGGEEIIMALPETAHESAAQVAERLRQHFAHASLPTDRGHITVTVSLGVATCIDTASLTLEHIIDQADQALYQAKQAGRNRVVTWDDNAVMP